jgi:hypothetical protein
MTHTELEINQQVMWRILAFEQRNTLTLAVEMLLSCQLSPEQILTKTAMHWKAQTTIREVCEGLARSARHALLTSR